MATKPRAARKTRSRATPATPPSPAPAPPAHPPSAPAQVVVGIGASAGGLEALERFFRALAPRTGLSFVVVQHLPAEHRTELPALLQRATDLPVEPLVDGAKLLPDRVYVSPPGKEASLLHGVVELFELERTRPRTLPIDFFFRSLAQDLGDRSVGVVLSGMGADGTLGSVSIDDVGGRVLVQDPKTAAFDGMPKSAIAAGVPALIGSPEELASRLLEVIRSPRLGAAEVRAGELEKIAVVLRARTANDFSYYKRSVLIRRVERRMAVHQLPDLPSYVRLLRESAQEQDLLFKELLIGVTRFFRDPEAWAVLAEQVLPNLVASRDGRPIRVWCVGCSTGEEAYSLAILLREALATHRPHEVVPVRIFATDLDPDAVEHARRGLYPDGIEADVSEARLRRWFVRDDSGGYRVGREIREMVTLAVHNVLRDPPFTRLDLVTCRNLLIYLESEAQKRLFPIFHYCLEPDGTLFLGSAETLGEHAGLFTAVERKWRVFQKKGPSLRGRDAIVPPQASSPGVVAPLPPIAPSGPVAGPHSLQGAADRLLLSRLGPAAVIVSAEGDILYVTGRTGRYLEPAAGRANWNVFAMVREELREELTRAFRKVSRRGSGSSVARGLSVRGVSGRTVDLAVHVVDEPQALRGTFIVSFTETPLARDDLGARKQPGGDAHARRAEAEVRRLQRELQTLREDMQTSNEELTSSNEELQSTNEELQSANEELTTSTEELQSLNEELQTINAEFQAKIDELSRANNDMKNLLDSTDIATLFLDRELCVRRFTPQAALLFKLRSGDLGRPITDIASSLIYPSLAEDVREVIRTLVFAEREVTTRDERWFVVRTMPYRTYESVIDGVVITFVEVTRAKRLEAELAAERAARAAIAR